MQKGKFTCWLMEQLDSTPFLSESWPCCYIKNKFFKLVVFMYRCEHVYMQLHNSFKECKRLPSKSISGRFNEHEFMSTGKRT